MADTRTLSAPSSFRRLALVVALGLAAAEIVLFTSMWQLKVLIDPGADPRAIRVFVVLGTVLTIQAMIVVGIAWMFVALSRTELSWNDRIRLEHPWRRWSGEWTDLHRIWWRKGWLALEVRGQWRRWYVRVPDAAAEGVMSLRSQLPPGVWLEGTELRAYYLRTVVPVLLAGIGAGGLALVALTAYLRSL
jgi:hypothetical protein